MQQKQIYTPETDWTTRDKESKTGKLVLPVGYPVKYASNPVLSPTGSWNRFVSGTIRYDYEDGIFKHWFYSDTTASSLWRILYTTCPESSFPYSGWTTPSQIVTPQYSDDTNGNPAVLKLSSTYVMYLHVKNGTSPEGIYRLTSADGTTWTWGSRVITPGGGGWRNNAVINPSIVYTGVKYYLLITGMDASSVYSLGLFASDDGISWTECPGNPILQKSGGGFEAVFVSFASLFYLDGIVYLAYSGYNGSIYEIGLCLVDGIDYIARDVSITTRRNTDNPIITKGAGSDPDAALVLSPVFVRHKENLQVVYSGKDSSGYHHHCVATF